MTNNENNNGLSFQTFNTVGGKNFGQNAIPKIREKLKTLGLDGIIIPHEDEWQNEYIPAAFERLLFATGFSGSAGSAIVTLENAYMFTDGRYTIQVKVQTDNDLFEYWDLVSKGPKVWLEEKSKGLKIGYDPKLFTPASLKTLTEAAQFGGGELVELKSNPIDEIWENRPAKPAALAMPHEDKFSGENGASKRGKIAESLSEGGNHAVILTSPPSIAWAFNIRGGDVSRSPLVLSNAIINNDATAQLFIAPEKVTPELKAHLGNGVEVLSEADFEPALAKLSGKNIAVDGGLTSAYIVNVLKNAGANVNEVQDPTTLPRAMKNETEIKGMINAHITDAVAMVKFLHWFDQEAPKGILTEISAAQKLESFRAQSPELVDLSFDSISGAVSNAAMAHYRVSEETNKTIEPNSFYLIDSGGQYKNGTTDITRTISVGEVSDEMKDRFTRVLKGHIALSSIKFPEGTPGCMLDTLARMALWDGGFDYDHGTGHGVGSYLGVHEGPQRIAKVLANIPLREGMILSNEPGFYKMGGYGIRTENLQYVTKATVPQGGERPMHSFVTLTLVPIDTRAVVIEMLSDNEKKWLNDYHAKVYKTIGPLVDEDTRDWLYEACKAV